MGDLALTDVGLGDKAAAFALVGARHGSESDRERHGGLVPLRSRFSPGWRRK